MSLRLVCEEMYEKNPKAVINFNFFPAFTTTLIACFHCYAIKNRYVGKSRIWKVKGDTYTKTFAKFHVSAILPNFIYRALYRDASIGGHPDGHQ